MSSSSSRHSLLAQGSHLASARCAKHARERIIDNLWNDRFPYSRKLSAHTSCVNTLIFSNGDARWLASAGDDQQVLLWDFHSENLKDPTIKLAGPTRNIFSLAFSASGKYLFAGGVDALVHQYDMGIASIPTHSGGQPASQPEGLCSIFRHHEESVRAIATHPVHDECFMTCSDDGRIILRDLRAGSTLSLAQGTIQHMAEFTAIRWHPTMERHFLTSDSQGAVCLRDMRMAFGPSKTRSKQGVVRTYATTVSKPSAPGAPGISCRPEVSDVTFNRDGTRFVATMMQYKPTMYTLEDNLPIATYGGEQLPSGLPVPDGQKTYTNICTMKHGSFGGPAWSIREYYSSGSDDFRGYVWEASATPELLDLRREIESDPWLSWQDQDAIAFVDPETKNRVLPHHIDRPTARLTGHLSIVNTVIMHPTMPHIVTAGVERHILVHSPTSSSPCVQDMEPTDTFVRQIPEETSRDRSRYIRALTEEHPTLRTEEDPENEWETILLFDQVLRREGNLDLFTSRMVTSYGDDDDSDDDDLDNNSDSNMEIE